MRKSKKKKIEEIVSNIMITKTNFVCMFIGDTITDNLFKAVADDDTKTLNLYEDFYNQLLCETKNFIDQLKG